MTFKRKLALVLPLIIYGLAYIFIFAVLEGMDSTDYFMPTLKIDHEIPFIPAFVIPYFAWFLWVPIVCGLLLIHDEENFIYTRRMLIIGMTAFLLFSYLIPTKLNLRPDNFPNEGLYGMLLTKLYSADTATNVFPSIHVYNTCVVWHSVMTSSSEKLFCEKWFRILTSIMSVLIIMSTMFIKQHSVIDVAGGLFLFGITYLLVKEFIEKTPLDRIGRVD